MVFCVNLCKIMLYSTHAFNWHWANDGWSSLQSLSDVSISVIRSLYISVPLPWVAMWNKLYFCANDIEMMPLWNIKHVCVTNCVVCSSSTVVYLLCQLLLLRNRKACSTRWRLCSTILSAVKICARLPSAGNSHNVLYKKPTIAKHLAVQREHILLNGSSLYSCYLHVQVWISPPYT